MSIKLPIYMDYHATTPVDPRVVEAMVPYFTEHFGNAASRNHPFGWEAEEAVEKARKQVADLIGANAKEIVFTSGATESDNLAIKGVAEMYREKGNHIITCVTEHKAVIDACKRLEKEGCRVTYLPVQKDGRISLDELRAAITDKTILITIMAANNETGVIQPVAEIGAIAKEKGVLFHTDAVQMVGKVPFNVNGPFQVFVMTDVDERIDEGGAEANNAALAGVIDTTQLRTHPDLVLTQIEAPSEATSGARTSEILSPTPPVECLSTLPTPRCSSESRAPVDNIASVRALVSARSRPRMYAAMRNAAI